MIRPDYRQIKQSSELYHYGIPRRSGRYPWGSGKKPYQRALQGRYRSKYFTSERAIPKGTKMYRTTSDIQSINPESSTYVTYLRPDRDLYKGGNIRLRDKTKKSYEYEITLKEDLKIPSRKTFIDTIKNVVDKNPNLLKESVESYLDVIIPENSWDRWEINTAAGTSKSDTRRWDKYVKDEWADRKNIPVESQWYEIASSLGKADGMKNAIIEDLKSKGYNAMVDEASVGGHGEVSQGIDPLIVFDSSVLDVGKVSKIGKKEEYKSSERYLKWRNKSTRASFQGRW